MNKTLKVCGFVVMTATLSIVWFLNWRYGLLVSGGIIVGVMLIMAAFQLEAK